MNEINKQPAENSARDKKSIQQNAERNPAKQQTIKRLLSYAGKSRGLLSLPLVLSGLSALVGSAATGFVLYYAALMLSHTTAFTIQENLSIRMTESHTELLERKGLYAGMWDNFQKGIEWKV